MSEWEQQCLPLQEVQYPHKETSVLTFAIGLCVPCYALRVHVAHHNILEARTFAVVCHFFHQFQRSRCCSLDEDSVAWKKTIRQWMRGNIIICEVTSNSSQGMRGRCSRGIANMSQYASNAHSFRGSKSKKGQGGDTQIQTQRPGSCFFLKGKGKYLPLWLIMRTSRKA